MIFRNRDCHPKICLGPHGRNIGMCVNVVRMRDCEVLNPRGLVKNFTYVEVCMFIRVQFALTLRHWQTGAKLNH